MRLGDDGMLREYADGEVVFREDESSECLYIVRSGSVRIRKEGDLVHTVLAELGPGEMFGELALIEQRTHCASAFAVGPTEVAVYDKSTFVDALKEDPNLALKVIESLASRLRRTTEQIQGICEQHVLDRAEMALLERAILETDIA